jgi:hypothetical protein
MSKLLLGSLPPHYVLGWAVLSFYARHGNGERIICAFPTLRGIRPPTSTEDQLRQFEPCINFGPRTKRQPERYYLTRQQTSIGATEEAFHSK